MKKTFNYIRVSSTDQNTARQLIDIPCNHTYEEKVSGKDQNRPQLMAMLDSLREGDHINVHEMSRLGRNMRDLLDIVDKIVKLGASIHFHKENITFGNGANSPMQTLMFQLLGSFAEFERALILERQKEGIAIAKAAGKYTGRKSRFKADQLSDIRARFNDPTTNKSELARELKIGRQYLYHLMADKADQFSDLI